MTDSPPVIRAFGCGRRRKVTANDRSGRKVTEFARVRMTKSLIFSARPLAMDGLAPFNYRKLPYVGPCGRRGQYLRQYREFPSETSLFSVCQYRKVPARSRRTVRSGRSGRDCTITAGVFKGGISTGARVPASGRTGIWYGPRAMVGRTKIPDISPHGHRQGVGPSVVPSPPLLSLLLIVCTVNAVRKVEPLGVSLCDRARALFALGCLGHPMRT